MKTVKDIRFGALTTTALPAYNQSNLNIGNSFVQEDGPDHFVGPKPVQVARPGSMANLAIDLIDVVEWSPNIHWIFLGDAQAAGVTRRIYLAEYNKSTNTIRQFSSILLTFPPATNHTMRGLRIVYNKYSVGTASVSGTAVTGVGSTWTTDRMSVGSRIGFGSTDPAQITTWYEISAVGSNTSITLTTSAGTISSGPYVIEDLIALVSTMNATPANGGLFAAKGLRIELFYGAPGASKTIPAATTVDNIRAVYWLADAATVLNTVANGLAVDTTFTSWIDQRCYVLDNTGANTRVYLYNYRVALAGLASGKSTSAFIHRTGTTSPTGVVPQRNNGVIATPSHGPGSGIKSLYWVTASNVYRSDVSALTNGGTGWLTDTWGTLVPPGGTNTYVDPATTNLGTIRYDAVSDRFFFGSTVANRDILTQYRTSGEIDRYIYIDDLQSDSVDSDSSGVVHPMKAGTSTTVVPHYVVRGGVLYQLNISTTVANNLLYVIPYNCDFLDADANNDFIITPRIDSSGATKLYNVYVNDVRKLGADTFSVQPEPWDLYYRTSGINDNSGAWTFIQGHGDLSAAALTDEIQFKLVFRTIGGYGVMNRIHNLSVVYEGGGRMLDSRYRWSFADTLVSSGIWGFTQTEYFYITPPVHTITIRRADTDAIVITQASTGTTNGVFEYWTGSAWAAGLDTDTKGKRRRFRATATLPAVDMYAELKLS